MNDSRYPIRTKKVRNETMYEHYCPKCGKELIFELGYSCGSPVAHWFCSRCNYDSWNELTIVTANTPIDFNDSRTPIDRK